MFIKLAFVILLSVEIEACNVRVRKIPANISDRLLRDPFTKKSFLKSHSYQESQNFEFKLGYPTGRDSATCQGTGRAGTAKIQDGTGQNGTEQKTMF